MAHQDASDAFRPRTREQFDAAEKPDIDQEGEVNEHSATLADKADIITLLRTMGEVSDKKAAVIMAGSWPAAWGQRCLVARDKNAETSDGHVPIIGMVHFDIRSIGSKKDGELSSLVVHPKYRGMGIGAPLLDRAIEAAREAGCTELELSINGLTSQEAIQMYEKRGFKSQSGQSKIVKSGSEPRDYYRLVL